MSLADRQGRVVRPSRRTVLSGALALAAVGCAWAPAAAEPMPPIEERIGALERRYSAVIGLWAAELDSGALPLAYRADEPFAMCSTFKGYVAGAILAQVGHGALSLDTRVLVDPAAVVANSPVTGPRAGGRMSLSQLCQAALQRSDNTAANLLLESLGGPLAITAFARSIGDGQTRLDRWETELNSAIPGDPRDTSTPAALAGGYRAMLAGDALRPQQRQLLVGWMRDNQTSSVRAGLPPGWTTADKTGSGDFGTANDVGIAFGPDGQRVLLAVMTHSQSDDPDAASLRPLVSELGRLVLSYLSAPH